ncbi:MAG: transcription elongation factor GreA [Gemmataceae bacterium]
MSTAERIPMTKEGYEKKKAEVEHMQNVEMPAITTRIAEARAEGDLKENAEYHGAREAQGLLQARINERLDQLARAHIVDPSEIGGDHVAFGARVTVKDLDLDEEETFELVGPGDEDYDNNKILVTSPIGQGLMGKKVEDVVEIQVPKGVIRFEIRKIAFG